MVPVASPNGRTIEYSSAHRHRLERLWSVGQNPGDYRHQCAADQLIGAIDQIGLETFNLAIHDRGTVQADYIAADHVELRTRLLDAWRCPVMILQGYESKTQPREFYSNTLECIPNSNSVVVRYINGGQFWSMESPSEVTGHLREFLDV